MASATQATPEANSVPPIEEELPAFEFCPSLILLIVSAAALHLSGHFLFDPLSWPRWGKELVALRDALPIVQGVLLAGFGVLGPGPWPVRWLITLTLLAGAAGVPAWRYGWENVIYLWGVMGIATWGALTIAVLFAWRGYAVDWPKSHEEGTVRWQFSLLHLIGITTAVAVTIGALRWAMGSWSQQLQDSEYLIGIATLGLGFALAALWIAWEVLRPATWWIMRIAALVITPLLPVAAWYAAAYFLPPRGLRFFGPETINHYLSDFLGWGVAFVLLLVVTLWVAREAGLRLIVVGGPGKEGNQA